MARKKGGLGKFIRSAYRALGKLNTANVLLSGNAVKIAKHVTRKRTVKLGGRVVKP